MNAMINWATPLSPPKLSENSKRVGLFFLVIGLIGLAVAGFRSAARTAPSPALLAEREGSRPLPHFPEPGNNLGTMKISHQLPPTTTIPVSKPVSPDPLLSEHSKKLADLDTVVNQVKGDIADMSSRLAGFQTDLHGIKQQLTQRPVFPKAINARHQGRADAVHLRQHRQRGKVNSHAVSSPKPLNAPGLQIVAINHWGAESRLIVREQDANQYRQLRMGDTLAVGTIVGMNARKVTLKNANGLVYIDLSKVKP